MPRSGKESRERLETAALGLFLARGFDEVTTAEIAAAAGVTERTYFRHFPDKREVLFDGERRLAEWVTDALAAVPFDVPAWGAMRRVADAIVPPIEANRAAADQLASIVAVTPALQERAAAKEVHLVALITRQLIDRGATAEQASLVARTTWGVLAHAIGAWRDEPGSALQAHVDRAFAVLGDLVRA
jgi:AcrR family transcriptional regulator